MGIKTLFSQFATPIRRIALLGGEIVEFFIDEI
jgi:hypothetical protein